jgi:pre-mRNA-processing factor 39
LWERFIDWELERKNLRNVTSIYRRLVAIPTKLYNRHWDNFIAHVRDHHPRDILEYDQYEELRRVTCEELGLTYRPDPAVQPDLKRDVLFPEDRLKAGMKERIVATVVASHEKCESEVEKRLKYEEKIKRTYFHVKPLDLKQLRNWDAYLDFEMEEGNHERIVVLFERCLIPAASYEQFWVKYAR